MAQFPDSSIMSIRSNTGIQIPNGSLAAQNKSTLIQIIKQLTNELSSVKSELSDVKGEVSDIREDTDRVSKQVADARGDVSDIREDTDRVSKKIADTNSRVSDLEENEDTDVSQSSEGQSSPDEGQGSDGKSTALEQVCALTDDESEKHLTANQKRARSIAKRVDEYSKSVQAGRAITSTRLRDILSGMEDKRIHRETIHRVIDFLERFGNEHVNKKETKGGKTVVVFTDEIVSRIKAVVTGNQANHVTPTIL